MRISVSFLLKRQNYFPSAVTYKPVKQLHCNNIKTLSLLFYLYSPENILIEFYLINSLIYATCHFCKS